MTVVIGLAAVALVALAFFTIRAALLVDAIRGADAVLATRVDLQQAYVAMGVSAVVFALLLATMIWMGITRRRVQTA